MFRAYVYTSRFNYTPIVDSETYINAQIAMYAGNFHHAYIFNDKGEKTTIHGNLFENGN